MIEIDKARQIMIVVTNGSVRYTFKRRRARTARTRSRRAYTAHTPEGVFTVIRQVNGPDHGPLGTLWRPKYFTWSGIAIHGYTSVPPYPASHGCTRVSNDAMNWIWATTSCRSARRSGSTEPARTRRAVRRGGRRRRRRARARVAAQRPDRDRGPSRRRAEGAGRRAAGRRSGDRRGPPAHSPTALGVPPAAVTRRRR